MSAASTPEFLVVGGSTRANRRSPAIAAWVAELGREAASASFRVVDLLDLDLGLHDEPGLPAKGEGYASASTARWSEMVQAAAGMVFVTPQYNWGYPAPLKNALDHLYREWKGKPALIVTYGGHGGGKCAAQLRQVLEGALDMRVVEAMPGLPLARARIETDDAAIDPPQDFADQADEVRSALRALAALAPKAG